MKRIYLVRHGESTSNVTGARQAFDDPLTDLGHKQAQFIAERVCKLPVEAFIASPFVRAKDTARYIAKRLDKEPEYSDLFVECNGPSQFRGCTDEDPATVAAYEEIRKNYGVPGWRFADEDTFEDQTTRAKAALAYLTSRLEEHVLVVTHGFFLRLLVAHVIFDLEPTPRDIEKIHHSVSMMDNTSVTVLLHDESKVNPWRVGVYNDHAHLG